MRTREASEKEKLIVFMTHPRREPAILRVEYQIGKILQDIQGTLDRVDVSTVNVSSVFIILVSYVPYSVLISKCQAR
uniref:ACT domain-containing protein n=1 Tax=Ascaris lumbricoides TaxID=6252 RepID=A0A0M3I2V1_ASCLU